MLSTSWDGDLAGNGSGVGALGFMHLFKTAGTTMSVLLHRFCEAHAIPYVAEVRGAPIPELAGPSRTDPTRIPRDTPLIVFHGHAVEHGFSRSLHDPLLGPLLRGRRQAFVVLLREPAHRMASWCTPRREPPTAPS